MFNQQSSDRKDRPGPATDEVSTRSRTASDVNRGNGFPSYLPGRPMAGQEIHWIQAGDGRIYQKLCSRAILQKPSSEYQ